MYARAFVVACNATLTPQLLFKSGIRLPALGKYICEQPLAFCQIVLKKELVPKGVPGSDPIGIPMSDPPPQVIKTYINYKTIRAIIFQYHIIKTAILICYIYKCSMTWCLPICQLNIKPKSKFHQSINNVILPRQFSSGCTTTNNNNACTLCIHVLSIIVLDSCV